MYGLIESILPSGYINRLKNERNLDEKKLAHYIKTELSSCIRFMEERDRKYYPFIHYEAGCYKLTECNYYDADLGHLIFTIGKN